MDVLNEFELKYFETKELIESIQSKLNDFVEEAVDEKAMDERARKKVDEIWEKNKINKKEGIIKLSRCYGRAISIRIHSRQPNIRIRRVFGEKTRGYQIRNRYTF